MGLQYLYRSRDSVAYDRYIRDCTAYGQVVDLDWQQKLDRPKTSSTRLLCNAKYRAAHQKHTYDQFETIHFFERNVYQHMPVCRNCSNITIYGGLIIQHIVICFLFLHRVTIRCIIVLRTF